MPHISSANPDSEWSPPTEDPAYTHGLDRGGKSFVPMAFQLTSPFNSRRALLPHALVMHVNPQTYTENHSKKIERIQTRGGFVEQHWGDELTDISAEGSTGAFMNIYTGLSSMLRHKTIAWDRYRDLHDLYRCNGSVFDPYGNIVLQGHVMLMFDRGTYIGHFTSFEVQETDDQPFAFRISWNFKVEEELLKVPGLGINPAARGAEGYVDFQHSNTRNAEPIVLDEVVVSKNQVLAPVGVTAHTRTSALVDVSQGSLTPIPGKTQIDISEQIGTDVPLAPIPGKPPVDLSEHIGNSLSITGRKKK